MDAEQLKKERERLDEEISRILRRDLNRGLFESMKKLEEITYALSNLQENLNHIWKRTEQLKEEIKGLIK